MAGGIRVRALQAGPSDAAAAQAIFSSGMHATIAGNLRRTPLLSFAALVLGEVLAAAVSAVCVHGAWPWPWAARGAAYVFLLGFLPHTIASDYVGKSLAEDMRDPHARYCAKRAGKSGFWLAVGGGGEVVGTVAAEPPSHYDKDAPWSGGGGGGSDVELRRMSVSESARGRGVSKQLFRELAGWCKLQGHTRVVLSTSSLQVSAGVGHVVRRKPWQGAQPTTTLHPPPPPRARTRVRGSPARRQPPGPTPRQHALSTRPARADVGVRAWPVPLQASVQTLRQTRAAHAAAVPAPSSSPAAVRAVWPPRKPRQCCVAAPLHRRC